MLYILIYRNCYICHKVYLLRKWSHRFLPQTKWPLNLSLSYAECMSFCQSPFRLFYYVIEPIVVRPLLSKPIPVIIIDILVVGMCIFWEIKANSCENFHLLDLFIIKKTLDLDLLTAIKNTFTNSKLILTETNPKFQLVNYQCYYNLFSHRLLNTNV